MSVPLIQVAEVALGRQRAPQHETGEHIVQYLRSANIGDGFLHLNDVNSMNFTPSEQATFHLLAGDVLVTEGSGSRDTVGSSGVWRDELPPPVCFQNTVLRVRPRPGISDGRYLAWWMRHAHASGLIAAVATGANILHLGAEHLRRLPIDLPSLVEQRRIADFLEDQVSRIDRAMALRQRQIDLFTTRLGAAMLGILLPGTARSVGGSPWITDVPEGWRVAPLKAAWQVVDCKHRTPTYVDSGFPVVSPGDVTAGRLDLALAHRFVDQADFVDLADPVRRCLPGDLVFSRNASAGTAAFVETSELFTMGQDVCRITSRDQDQLFLMHVLNFLVTPQLDAARVGSTFTRINVDEIKALKVPIPPGAEQTRLAQRCDDIWFGASSAQSALSESLKLLLERKKALITAAVTGEVDVTTASGKGVA
jgi:type I restriction enzyme S subunit